MKCGSSAASGAVFPCEAHEHNEPLHDHGRPNQIDDEPTRNDNNRHGHECEGSNCSFIRPEKLPEQTGELCAGLCRPEVAVLPATLELFRSHQLNALDRSPGGNSPPLRAHLLLSVLLI